MKQKDNVIIKYLIEHKEKELSILGISKALRIDYKNVYMIIKRLEKESLIKLETFGNSKRVKLINEINPKIFEAEYNRRKNLLKDRNMLIMLNDIEKISSKYYVLLLFGSYAKKTQTKNSDIDLMFIVPEGKEDTFEKEINIITSTLPLPIHFLIFSEKQFKEMINSNEHNVGKEALRDNIILYGIEMYYELI